MYLAVGEGREGEGGATYPYLNRPSIKTTKKQAPPKPRALFKLIVTLNFGKLEARVGIEPTYTDLQSAASPLCHRATVPVHGASSPVRKVT
jgi:hypothetical protein